jgi:hypothetical protein
MEKQLIQYGFGLDYLEHWEISHALREIFQNYLDFGYYDIQTIEEKNTDNLIVSISNKYTPTDLEFLRIGNSGKRNDSNTIGKYGEGLKMAFLVFKREGLKIKIRTQTHEFIPTTYTNELGVCFGIEYTNNKVKSEFFTTMFTLPKPYYEVFIKNIITSKDIEYTNEYWGSIVNKPKGNIYVGKLFVTNMHNYSKAYNFNPSRIPLDRDRAMPSSFDIKYAASQINNAYGKWNASDIKYEDMQFISQIDEVKAASFTPKIVGNSIQFVTPYIDAEGNKDEIVVQHDNLKNTLLRLPFFANAINSLRKMLMKGLGLYDLLLEFERKHYMDDEMSADFKIILERSKAT